VADPPDADSSITLKSMRPDARATRWALGLLLVVNVVSQIDRQIMNILVEPVRAEFGLSDGQLGLLVGLAFALFHTFAGIPIARVADRWSRRNLIAICLAIWSCMTALCGVARNFSELLVARVGVGVGEAGCSPSAQSLIGDYFPPEARGRALSIYQLGVPLGILIGLAFGGFVSDRLGWRAAFFVVGLPGILLSVVTWLGLLEPPRGTFEKDAQSSEEVEPVAVVLRYLWRQRTMRHMLIAASLHTATAASHVTFNPAFLQRFHGLSGTEAGLALGFVTGIAGGIGTFAGGWFGDRLGLRPAREPHLLRGRPRRLSIPGEVSDAGAHRCDRALLDESSRLWRRSHDRRPAQRSHRRRGWPALLADRDERRAALGLCALCVGHAQLPRRSGDWRALSRRSRSGCLGDRLKRRAAAMAGRALRFR
jgi:predicted MFS family arabinose efflux permease